MSTALVTVLADAESAHLQSYIQALAGLEECASVVVADPSGSIEKYASATLAGKLKAFERGHMQALSRHRADLALVTLEGSKAPPVILASLEAGCHVLAEKPACVRAEDFEPLVQAGEMRHRHVTLAFANRMRRTVQTAKKLVQGG